MEPASLALEGRFFTTNATWEDVRPGYEKLQQVPYLRTFKLQTFEDMNMPRERTKREEGTEELKRFMMQEIARGFSLFEGVLLVVEAQD